MSKILVICHSNWADEMDLDGFKIFDKEEWERKKQKIKDWFAPKEAEIKELEAAAKAKGQYYYNRGELVTVCVGTNEEVHYGSYQDWISEFKEKDITDQEAQVITNLLLNNRYQNEFGFFMDIEEHIDENI